MNHPMIRSRVCPPARTCPETVASQARRYAVRLLILSLPLAWSPAGLADPAVAPVALPGAAAVPAAIPPADLPDAAAVLRALAEHPATRAAQAERRAAQAEQARLRAGEHEFLLGLTGQRRTVSGDGKYSEWDATLERGLRLPGKARLDNRLGELGVEEAEERIGDARHEAARQILSLWYGVRRADAEARLWQQQAELLAEQRRIVQTRVKRGDAARLELLQAEAAQAQARAAAGQAEARRQTARAELAGRFPSLPLPAEATAEPAMPPGDAAEWTRRALEHNHELLAMQRALDMGRVAARRAEADRVPDPALGLRYARERGGDESLWGVTLSVPLPGAGRQAVSAARLARADALAEQEAATRRRLALETEVNWRQARAGVENHQRLGEAAAALGRHADLARRAYELGETSLGESLNARRAALEVRLAAEQARLDANEAIARLLLDAHGLWPLGEEGGHHGG